MKSRIYFTFLIIGIINFLNAQTNVSGGIYSNTIWTLSNSPYVVTNTLVIFPGNTLTIDAGVIVKFDNDMYIEARQSSIVANGTTLNPILFTSNSSTPFKGIYQGLRLNQSTKSKFNHCEFKYADKAIYPSNMYDTIQCKNSVFDNNNSAIGFVYYSTLLIDSCSFTNNKIAINGATTYRAKVENSTFSNNVNGIDNLEGVKVVKSTFQNNTGIAIRFAQNDTIINCVIQNNDTAIVERFGGGSNATLITNNSINNNNLGLNIYYGDNIYCNSICNSFNYNVKMINTSNTNLGHNYFCLDDSLSISNTIYDGYDNFTVGLINFIPFDTVQCNLITEMFENKIENNVIRIFPNPFSNNFKIILDKFSIEEFSIIIYNSIGEKLNVEAKVINNELEFDASVLKKGLYFIKIESEHHNSKTFKLIKN